MTPEWYLKDNYYLGMSDSWPSADRLGTGILPADKRHLVARRHLRHLNDLLIKRHDKKPPPDGNVQRNQIASSIN
ncbi:MAG: hypothetical protein WBO29_05920 [Albidovulum sp.]